MCKAEFTFSLCFLGQLTGTKLNPPEAPARNTGEYVPHLMLLNSFICDHTCEASRHTQILLSLMRGEKQVPSVQGSNLSAPSIMEPLMCVPES